MAFQAAAVRVVPDGVEVFEAYASVEETLVEETLDEALGRGRRFLFVHEVLPLVPCVRCAVAYAFCTGFRLKRFGWRLVGHGAQLYGGELDGELALLGCDTAADV